SDLVAATDPALDAEMQTRLADTVIALGRIKTAAEGGFSYDQMLERGNEAGEALIMGGVNGFVAQTESIERVVAALDLSAIEFEGSDSLDNPNAVFE
ncbi:MAG: imelysin family protein, partial [Pseudomonadota bacterium]